MRLTKNVDLTSQSVVSVGRSNKKYKMATLDDSPSLFSGQSWSLWAENVNEDRTKSKP